jgi:hypothetical protein
MLCPDDRTNGNLPNRLHIGANSAESLSAAAEGRNPTDLLRCAFGLPTSAFLLADLRPGTPGPVKSLGASGNYLSRRPAIGVQLGVAKSNYHQVRRQKELVRKTRQQEKQQKRLAAKSGETVAHGTDPVAAPGESASAPAVVNAPVDGTSAS